MSSISCLVTNLDCCSSQIGFTYKGKRRYKSLIGGCLTIICFRDNGDNNSLHGEVFHKGREDNFLPR